MKTCSKCSISKALGEFGKNKATASGVSHWCKSCNRQNALRYRAKNIEKVKAQQAADGIAAQGDDVVDVEGFPQDLGQERRPNVDLSHRRAIGPGRHSIQSKCLGHLRRGDDPRVVATPVRLAVVDGLVMPPARCLCQLWPVFLTIGGLHVHTNLQVLGAFENQSKGNRFTCQQ